MTVIFRNLEGGGKQILTSTEDWTRTCLQCSRRVSGSASCRMAAGLLPAAGGPSVISDSHSPGAGSAMRQE